MNKQSMISAVPSVKDQTLLGSVKSMWQLTKTTRFLYLVPQLFWTGISIAYYSGNLVEMMTGTL
jgi:hypothetical protein